MNVVLIGCSKEKLDHEAPARRLYQGRLFLAAVAYAEAIGARWFVLSAAHGLVDPDETIAPYDVTLNTMGDAQRSAWGARVAQQLHAAPADLIVLAGESYITPWSWAVPNKVLRPLEGLPVGARFKVLKEMTAVAGAAVGRAGSTPAKDEGSGRQLAGSIPATADLDQALGFLRDAVNHHAEALLTTDMCAALDKALRDSRRVALEEVRERVAALDLHVAVSEAGDVIPCVERGDVFAAISGALLARMESTHA